MSEIDSKRCFECGATYPADVHFCQHDGAPLCPPLLGGHWQVEGVLGLRPAGGRFAAFHVVSGNRVAIDYLPPDAAATHVQRLQREVQARGLLSHPVAPRLFEEGSASDGASYFVSELGTARTLQDIVEEHTRPSGLLSSGNLGVLARPLLGLLSAAHRMGIAHGSIDLATIVVTSDDDFSAGLDRAAGVKLHGLQLLGLGPELRSAAQQDLRGLAIVFYELLIGQRPTLDSDKSEQLRAAVEPLGAAGQILLRALGVGPAAEFSNADEFLRGLIATFGPMPAAQVDPQAAMAQTDPTLEKVQLPSGAMPAVRKGPIPTPNSLPALPPPPSVPGAKRPGPVRLSGTHAVLPAPLAALSNPGLPPQRSGLTGELKQISIHDLMAEEEQPKRDETLARSRERASMDNIAIPTVLPPGGWRASDAAPSQPGVLSSGEHSALDRTADLNALPIDYGSQISGRIITGATGSADANSLVSAPHPLSPPSLPPLDSDSGAQPPAAMEVPAQAPSPALAAVTEAEPARQSESELPKPSVDSRPATPPAAPALVASAGGDRPAAPPAAKVDPTHVTSGGPPTWLWVALAIAALLICAAAIALLRR